MGHFVAGGLRKSNDDFTNFPKKAIPVTGVEAYRVVRC
jgi:hypothetical protein